MPDYRKHNASFYNQTVEYDPKRAQKFGPYSQYAWQDDPKHLFFTMARYKFCFKLLTGRKSALDIGCGEAFYYPILLQGVEKICGIDIVSDIIRYNSDNYRYDGKANFACHDIIDSPMDKGFDSAVSIDTLEHIEPKHDDSFVGNIGKSLRPHSVFILGTPNVASAKHASKLSQIEHINLKSHTELVALMKRHFHNVFLFSMNDEMVHTGFYPMAHYFMAVAIDPKQQHQCSSCSGGYDMGAKE